MDDSVVGPPQRSSKRRHDPADRSEAHGPSTDTLPQRHPEPLHHEVAASVEHFAEGKDVDDVRMADLIDRACFVDKPLNCDRRLASPARTLTATGLPING
jgi:hypothetical protein